MADKYVLCRRDLADIGEKPCYCCKPIKRASVFNWCEECLARLPIWPTEGK